MRGKAVMSDAFSRLWKDIGYLCVYIMPVFTSRVGPSIDIFVK